MLHCSREAIAKVAVFTLALMAVLGFSSDAAAQSLQSSGGPELAGGGAQDASLAGRSAAQGTVCEETRMLGDFRLTLESVVNDVAAGTSTWNYKLDWDEDTDPPIDPVRVVIGLCPEFPSSILLASSPPGAMFGTDPVSGIYGIRWDPLPPTPPAQLSFTLSGFYAVTEVEFGVAKGDANDKSTICGVSCYPICVVEVSCPPNMTVDCSEGVDPALTGQATAIGSCPPFNVTYTDVVTAGNCANEYLITRTWVATDASGGTDSCEQLITVVDEFPPQIACPSETLRVQCPGDVPAADPGVVEASDACGTVSVTHVGDEVQGEGCDMVIVRTYRATDECGNFAECEQVIMVKDTTPPVITCPGDTRVSCMGEVPEANPELVDASDNCGGPVTVVHVGDEVEGETCPKTITRTYRATDECGNSAECKQLIVVADGRAPEIKSCPEALQVECIGDVPEPDPSLVVVKDNCPGVVVRHVEDVYEGVCPTTISRVYEAVDECGNAAQCVQTITVEDVTAPVLLTCPQSIEVQCIGDMPPADVDAVVATDNCGSVTVTHVGDVSDGNSCPETITRTYRVEDECGNAVDCQQLIVVNDTTPPALQCPGDLVVECGAGWDGGEATATDNCGGAVEIGYQDEELEGQCALDRIIRRTWTATDACGNSASCVQVISILDRTPPVITCPEDLTFECDEVDGADFGQASATDACDPSPVLGYVDVEVPGSCPQEITIERTWTATDACGNSASCMQLISVVDTTPPVITCPSETLKVLCGEELPDPDPDSVDASDNCGSVTVEYVGDTPVDGPGGGWLMPSGDPGQQSGELIARRYRATDECGNSAECVQMILLEEDTTPPVIECEGFETTVECGQGLPVPTPPAVWDNCDPSPTLTSQIVETPGECPEIQTVQYVYTATDAAGNTTTVVCGVVTVMDTSPPRVVCPDTMWVDCGGAVPEPTAGDILGEDDCGEVIITHVGDESGGQVPVGQIYRTYRATDGCGNIADCTQVIMIADDVTPPVIACQPVDITAQCDGDFTEPPVPDVYDECDPNCQVDVIVDEVRGDCPHDWEITKTVVATDAAGNTSSCEYFHVKVQDTTPPEITCPDTMRLGCGEEVPPADVNLVEAVDNCSDEVAVTHVGDSTVVGAAPGVILRTYRATDECGNSADCVQVIIREEDTTPPVITTCPGERRYECDEDWSFPTNDWAGFEGAGGVAEDDCSTTLTAGYTRSGPVGACPKVWTLTWTVTDEAGNASQTCDQLIKENDTTAPVVTTCPTDLEFEGPDLVVYPESSWSGFVNSGGAATDNCDTELEVGYTMGDPQGQCPTIIVLTWTVTDDCGNMDTCDQTVTINCPSICGRWTGGGTIDGDAVIPEGAKVSHGFEFRCNLSKPNRLQVSWDGNKFHMTELLSVECFMNPNLPPPGSPDIPMNEVFGSGEGRYNKDRGYVVEFHFTDGGEPCVNDYAEITITAPDGEVILQAEGHLSRGSHQAHKDKCEEGALAISAPNVGGGGGETEVGQVGSGTSLTQSADGIPPHFTVLQGVPNPFSNSVKIGFGIPVAGVVKVEVYDVAGRRLATLLDKEQTPGFHSVIWDGRNAQGEKVAPGVYFTRVRYNGQSDVKKMIVME